MDKNISITVSGTQLNENGQKLLTEIAAEGQYFERGGCRYILFDETDPETLLVTGNTLKFKDHMLELSRRGNVTSRMVFETGKTHRTSYTTAYGTLILDISTEVMSEFWSEGGATVHIRYQILAEGSLLSENELKIKIRNLPAGD